MKITIFQDFDVRVVNEVQKHNLMCFHMARSPRSELQAPSHRTDICDGRLSSIQSPLAHRRLIWRSSITSMQTLRTHKDRIRRGRHPTSAVGSLCVFDKFNKSICQLVSGSPHSAQQHAIDKQMELVCARSSCSRSCTWKRTTSCLRPCCSHERRNLGIS